MKKTELKVRKELKWELTKHAIAEIKENMETDCAEYAIGVAWFMLHSGLWSSDTAMFVSEKISKDETPTICEVIYWEENA